MKDIFKWSVIIARGMMEKDMWRGERSRSRDAPSASNPLKLTA